MSQEEKTGLEQLFDKKLITYLGTYLAVGFGLMQFLETISNRYSLSHHWVDRYLIIWLCLIPAIALLAHYGSKMSGPRGIKWPRYAIIGNVVLALAASGLGGSLVNQAAAEELQVVEVTDEEGKKVTAVVPSIHKIKKLAIFQLDNIKGTEEDAWWGVAFGYLLDLDMYQRPEFYTASPVNLNAYHDELGLPSFEVPNVGMQKEIAKKSRKDYFTRLSYDVSDGNYLIKGEVYKVSDGRSLFSIEAAGQDPYDVIDDVKTQILNGIPDALETLEHEESLPASSLLTSDLRALEYFTQSRISFYKDPTALDKVIALQQKAIDLDPTCALCYFWLGDPLYGQGKTEEAIDAFKKAVQYSRSLPDRMQFGPKETLYSLTNRLDAYRQLQEVKKKMFPYDFGPYALLASIYQADYGIDSAKSVLYEAIDNGNIEMGLLNLYSLELEYEEYDNALKTLNRLSEAFPDRDQDRLKYAQIYESQGKLQEARELLFEEEVMDPLNADIQTRIAMIDYRDQKVDDSVDRLRKGLAEATTLSDSLNFYQTKRWVLFWNGQIKESLDVLEEHDRLAVKLLPINRVILNSYFYKVISYLSIGENESVARELEKVLTYSPQLEKLYKCQTTSVGVTEDLHRLQSLEEYADCRDEYVEYSDGWGEFFDVIVAYENQDFSKAVSILEQNDGKVKTLYSGYENLLANIYNKHGDFEEAKRLLTKSIDKKDYHPKMYYEMAKLLSGSDKAQAKQYLDVALTYWKDADADYIYKQRAEDLRASMQ